jgi:excisionase family DNA binding protein
MKALVRLLSVKETADILNVSTWTVREKIAKGELRTVRIGRRLLIDPSDLEEFIEQNKQG